MRFLRETLFATLTLSAFGILQAIVGSRELAGLRPTTVQPSLPWTQLSSVIGFALSLALYAWLARAVVRGGGTARAAAARGALVGLVAGLVTDIAQAPVQNEFFRAVALAYGASDTIAALFGLGVLIARPLLGAMTGAVLGWLAGRLQSPRYVT